MTLGRFISFFFLLSHSSNRRDLFWVFIFPLLRLLLCISIYLRREPAPFSCWWTKLNDRPEEHVIPLASETNDLKKTTRSHMKKRNSPPPNNRSSIIYFPSAENLVCFLFFWWKLETFFWGMRHVGQTNRPVWKGDRRQCVTACLILPERHQKKKKKKNKKCWASSFTSCVCRLSPAGSSGALKLSDLREGTAG